MTADTHDPAGRSGARRALARNAALVVPLALVNGFAVYGQALWALDNITRWLIIAVLFAVALESIGLFLAAEAHSALMAGDAALRLRAGSYGVAAVVGTLNYSHWAPDWSANPKAVTFAALSAVSPWLWSIRSRSMHRAELRAKGLIDPRTVRFSAARWLLYPGPSFTAFRRAVWVGETDPALAAALGPVMNVTQPTPTSRGVTAAVAPRTATPVQPQTPAPADAALPVSPGPASNDDTSAATVKPAGAHACDDTCTYRRQITGYLDASPDGSKLAAAKKLGYSRTTIRAHWPDDDSNVYPLRAGARP